MSAFELAVAAMIIMFAVSATLLVAVVVLKLVNNRRRHAHQKRRAAFLKLLSKHIAAPGSVEELTVQEAGDDAFLDAVIDVRHMLAGPTVEELAGIIDRTGLIGYQAKRLQSRFPLGRRLRAAVSLAEIADARAAKLLLQHLNDPIPEIRVQAARGLARMRYTAAIDVILDRFNHETPWVRSRFAESLALFDRDVVWPLMAFVRVHHNHEDDVGVPDIVRILGVIGDSEVGPPLAELLYTATSVEVKIAIIETLGLVGGPMALRPLRRMIQSNDWRIRAKTASAFSEIGDPSVKPTLAEGLEDPSWWVRRNCAAGLAHLPGGIDFLHKALDSDDEFSRDAAAEALADSGELVAARDRLEAGTADERDFKLVAYMHSSDLVSS
ncbi:MAG: HEAT repeat domain-containing protein [Actinobacteria bacterium]|nr:MAG: HEAT repeat domain-containing protein [Actinomycetota bacterium]